MNTRSVMQFVSLSFPFCNAEMPSIFVLSMSKISKILIVCNRVPYPLKDGGAVAMYGIIKAWHEAGKELHVLAMNTSRHSIKENELPKLFSEITSFEMVAIDNAVRPLNVIRNFLFSEKPEHVERFYNKAFENKLLNTIKAINPDLIQVESIYLHEYALAIRQHSKALLIQRLHNIEGAIWKGLAERSSPFFKKFYLKNLAKRIALYEQKVWKESDALLPIAHADEKYIQESGILTPTFVLPFGVEIIENLSPINNKKPLVAYHIGAMDWLPNQAAIEWLQREIIPAIVAKVPEFSFHFAGRNMPEKWKECKEPSFFCEGEIKDAAAFIADKQILLVPLLSGSGIRIKTLEAMALGKLVISTGIGVQGMDAKDKIHYLQAETAEEFAAAVHWAMRNKESVAAIIANAHTLVKTNHHQSELMKGLVDFVESL